MCTTGGFSRWVQLHVVNKYLNVYILSSGHAAGPSAVDTVVDNPSGGKVLRSKRQKALPPEERRKTRTRRQVRHKVKFEIDEASVQEPKTAFRSDKNLKTYEKKKGLPHALQESGDLGAHKEEFGKLGGQAKKELSAAPVQSSSQSRQVPLETSLIVTEEAEKLRGTSESFDNVQRQLKQSNLESSGVTDEAKTRQEAAEGAPRVDVKQVADIESDTPGTSHRGLEVLPAKTETIFGPTQGKRNVKEPVKLPTPNLLVSLVIGVHAKCNKLINICIKAHKFLDTGNEMPENLLRESVVLRAETEATFGTIQDELNINEPNTAPIPKHTLSLAVEVLTKCEKLANMCRKITDVFPDRLPPQIMTSFNHPLHPRLFFMLAEISFLIIKLFSELISALMYLIYIIIHAHYMNILPENIIPSLDTMMVALLDIKIKYNTLCIRYIHEVNILTPGELEEALQYYQTECRETDKSEQTETAEMSSQLSETFHEQDETCSLALSEVPLSYLSLLQKDSVKIRLTVIGIKLSLIGEKILPSTTSKKPSE
jgi:hypothetical protein